MEIPTPYDDRIVDIEEDPLADQHALTERGHLADMQRAWREGYRAAKEEDQPVLFTPGSMETERATPSPDINPADLGDA